MFFKCLNIDFVGSTTDSTDNSDCNAFLGDIQGVTTLTQNTLACKSFEPTNDDFPY
jgi:hypothetical protein